MAVSYADRAKNTASKTKERVPQPRSTPNSIESSNQIKSVNGVQSNLAPVASKSTSSGPVTNDAGHPPPGPAPHQHNLIHHQSNGQAGDAVDQTHQDSSISIASSSGTGTTDTTSSSSPVTTASTTNAWVARKDAPPTTRSSQPSSSHISTIPSTMATQSESPRLSTQPAKKRKFTPKSAISHQPSDSNSTVVPPSFEEPKDWPAPSEATIATPSPNSDSALPGLPKSDDPASAIVNQTKEEPGASMDPTHSRDGSSVTGSTSHSGKKRE